MLNYSECKNTGRSHSARYHGNADGSSTSNWYLLFSFSFHFFVTVSPWLSRCCRWTKVACPSPERLLLWDGWKHYRWVHFQILRYANSIGASWVIYMKCIIGLNCTLLQHMGRCECKRGGSSQQVTRELLMHIYLLSPHLPKTIQVLQSFNHIFLYF